MQVTVEATGGLGRKMTVKVPAARIDLEVEKRLNSMCQRVKIHGFRPGKVPFRVVKQRFGNQVQQEVMNEVLLSSYQEAVTQQKLRPAGGPRITPGTMGAGKGLTYTVTFEVLPEIELASIERLIINKPTVEITEADIDGTIEKLQKQRKTWQEVTRAAKPKDRLVIDFESQVNGEVVESGAGISLELGSGKLLTALEDQLIGALPGEARVLKASYPDTHQQKSIAGKVATFNVNVKTVSAPVLPEVNDELANSFGINEGGVQQLRKEIRETMERELAQKIKVVLKERVMSNLLDLNNVELPEVMVQEAISRAREQMIKILGQSDKTKFSDELFEQDARKRVALALLINEIVRTQAIALDEVKVQQMIESIASSYDDPQQIIHHYRSNERDMANIKALVMEEQVVEWVINKAKVNEENLSYDQLMLPAAAEINHG